MSEVGQLLEPAAEQILGEIRAERIARLRKPLNTSVPIPDLPRDSEIHAFSAAVSAKRTADALDRIAEATEKLASELADPQYGLVPAVRLATR